MNESERVLGMHVRVVNSMSQMVTATVSKFPYDGTPMDDLTREELRLLVVSLLGLIDNLGSVLGEETVLRMVRSIALPAQRGAIRD